MSQAGESVRSPLVLRVRLLFSSSLVCRGKHVTGSQRAVYCIYTVMCTMWNVYVVEMLPGQVDKASHL